MEFALRLVYAPEEVCHKYHGPRDVRLGCKLCDVVLHQSISTSDPRHFPASNLHKRAISNLFTPSNWQQICLDCLSINGESISGRKELPATIPFQEITLNVNIPECYPINKLGPKAVTLLLRANCIAIEDIEPDQRQKVFEIMEKSVGKCKIPG